MAEFDKKYKCILLDGGKSEKCGRFTLKEMLDWVGPGAKATVCCEGPLGIYDEGELRPHAFKWNRLFVIHTDFRGDYKTRAVLSPHEFDLHTVYWGKVAIAAPLDVELSPTVCCTYDCLVPLYNIPIGDELKTLKTLSSDDLDYVW